MPGQIEAVAVDGDVAYVATRSFLTAIGLRQGKIGWSIPRLKEGVSVSLAIHRERLIVVAKDGNLVIEERDLRAGVLRWSEELDAYRDAVYHDGLILLSGKNNTLAAWNPTHRQILWERVLPGDRVEFIEDYLEDRHIAYYGWARRVKGAIDPRSGAIHGTFSTENRGPYLLTEGLGLFLQERTFIGRRVPSGEELWRCQGIGLPLLCHAGRFVFGFEGGFRGIDPRSGHRVWECRVNFGADKEQLEWDSHPVPLGEIFLFQAKFAYAVDDEGQLRWQTDRFCGTRPVWIEGNALATYRGNRFFGYLKGAEEEDFTFDPRSIEEYFEDLDPWERNRVDWKRPGVFDALFRRWQREGSISPAFSRALADSVTPDASEALVQALRSESDFARSNELWTLLARAPNRSVVGPYLRNLLMETPRSQWEERWIVPLFQCEDGEAADLLIQALDDPQVPAELRDVIRYHLAGLGPRAEIFMIDRIEGMEIDPSHWPGITRRAERDIERALEAAYAVFAPEGSIELVYPEGFEPFAMRGAPGIRRLSKPSEEATPFGLSLIWGLKGAAIRDRYEEGDEIVFEAVINAGPLCARAWDLTVRKFEGGWAPVRAKEAWVS